MKYIVNRPKHDQPGARLMRRRDILRLGAAALAGTGLLRAAGAAASQWDEREDTTIYRVVVNREEQYSIWPAHRENPPGWSDAGFSGTKAECLDYIKDIWTDMRPMSLRDKMEGRTPH
jgi:MbtH protein